MQSGSFAITDRGVKSDDRTVQDKCTHAAIMVCNITCTKYNGNDLDTLSVCDALYPVSSSSNVKDRQCVFGFIPKNISAYQAIVDDSYRALDMEGVLAWAYSLPLAPFSLSINYGIGRLSWITARFFEGLKLLKEGYVED